MKLCFIFDVRFTKYKDRFYSINLSQSFWQTRYLKVFDEIIVVGRYKETDTDPDGKLVRSDCEKVRFDCIQDRHPIERMLNQKPEQQHIAKMISESDAVICRGWWGVDECIKQKKKYLIEVVSCYWDAYWNHGFLGKLIAPYQYLNMKKRVKNAPYVIYVTSEFLQKRYPTFGKFTNISNVMLEDTFDESTIEKRIEHIQSQGNALILGTAAAVDVRYKGQKYVIRALKRLKKKGHTKILYRILGSGDPAYLKQCAIKNNVQDMVEFCGSKPHDEVFSWMDNLDIYIQSSLQEGLPRAMIEAMSRGLPCIGARTGGIPELIDDQWICSHKTKLSKEIAQKVEAMINIDKQRQCALRNYSESKKYEKRVLEYRRYEFLRRFVQDSAYGKS